LLRLLLRRAAPSLLRALLLLRGRAAPALLRLLRRLLRRALLAVPALPVSLSAIVRLGGGRREGDHQKSDQRALESVHA
jgi:hypothetical protein